MTGGAAAANDLRRRQLHWPALDGLRGVAVAAVVLFHAYSFTPNGYVGVDVFFALSGFLITALLLTEHDARGRVSLRDFYMRRVLRLYPALVATVLLVLLATAVGGRLDEAWPGMLAALFYVAHLWIYTGHEALLLEHTWTLSLEEHYYLVWPALLLGFLSVRRTRRLAALVALLVLALLLVAPWFLPEGVRAAYERGAPMAYGSLAALAWHARRRAPGPGSWLSWVSGAALVLLVLVSFWPVALPGPWLTGWTSVPGVLSVVVVVGFVWRPSSTGARLLGWAPLRWLGKRAYGVYLYHFPILSLLVHQVTVGPEWGRASAGVLLTLAIAAASYRWLEVPFLRLKDRFRPWQDPSARARPGHSLAAGPPASG